MRTILAFIACVLLSPLVACGDRTPGGDSADQLRIAATIPPLEWIARSLAPEGTSISTLLPPGASEHGYEPPPSRLADFVRADVVLMVGLGLDDSAARALRNAPKGGRAVVIFADAAGVAAPVKHDGHDHAHDHDHHAESSSDPHLWLDPPLMASMVKATHDALARQLTRRGATEDSVAALAARRDELLAQVARIHDAYRDRLAPFSGAAIVTAHDSMRRPADRYGLRVVGVVHSHEGAEPTPGDVLAAAQGLREASFRAILVEPQSGRAIAERLSEETGAPIAEFDPLGSGDWEATMRANLESLERAFAASGTGAR
jgi:zinc transport system substrate-binding protein